MSYQHKEQLDRNKKPNIVDGQLVHEEEEGHIPEEFTENGDVGKPIPDSGF